MIRRHKEYGLLVTYPGHTLLHSTHMTERDALDKGADLAVARPSCIVTLAVRMVTYDLGDWEVE